MEEIKRWANPKGKGLVGDPSQVERVAQYLKALATAEVEVERDEARQRTKLKGKGEVLAGLVRQEAHWEAMGRLTETARWKRCVPRLEPITASIARGFYGTGFSRLISTIVSSTKK